MGNNMEPLLELSLDQLSRSAEQAFPGTTARQHNVDQVAVKHIELLPAEGHLLAKGIVRGSQGKEYQVAIQFEGVEYNPEDGGVTFVANGKEYSINPLDKTTTNVKVACTCLDFRWRFAQHNDAKQTLFGPKPSLYAKVPNSKRGYANPTSSPGVCKHLLDFSDSLDSSGLFS